MKTAYIWIGGGVVLAVIAGATIASLTRNPSTSVTNPSSPSPTTEAVSPTVVANPTGDPNANPTGDPSSVASPVPSPIEQTSDPTLGSSPVAIAPQTTGTSNPIQIVSCKITTVTVSDPDPPLNLRSTPEVKPDNIVGKLNNGTVLQVKTERDGWFQVSVAEGGAATGWVSKQRTDHSCNQKVASITLKPGSVPVAISDRFVGSGTHEYQLTAKKGQTMVLTVKSGPAPYLLDPNGKLIAGDGQGGGITSSWSGALPADGRYTIAFDSNFRGYAYSISVQLK
ncbi:MAG: SH3 domain-containing protein [Cyanobacteria bacterium]|nr:SH3 domain-containing protein [Cyanobacteriota bacterium]MDW8202252.1 SH3 domain-containing protein [Cyanobacteriota bacterium SKYGB_h_bin112]